MQVHTISNVRKAIRGYINDESQKQSVQISNQTQALKLFKEGKRPIEVAIELDIATDFVFSIYQNFERLRNLEAFISAYELVKGNMQPFLDFFYLMKDKPKLIQQI